MKEYRLCIISFFDILGFGDIVDRLHCDEIYKLLGTFRHFTLPKDSLSKEVIKLKEIGIINFSDTVIRTVPIDNESNLKYPDGLVFHELIDLIHIQGELIAKGILIRGAVTLGNVFHSEELIYGPGIIDTYLLEKEKAKNPRIIVHKMLIEAIKKMPLLKALHHDAAYEEESVRKLLKADGDGHLFIDYLKIMENEVEDLYDYRLFLQRHKQIIDNGLLSKDNKILKKYRWLKKYHNNLVKKFRKEDCKLLGVDKKELIA